MFDPESFLHDELGSGLNHLILDRHYVCLFANDPLTDLPLILIWGTKSNH